MNLKPSYDPTHYPLTDVRDGMKVVDVAGHHVGNVRIVRNGDENPETAEIETVTAKRPEFRDDSLIDNLLEGLFGRDDLPETVRNRLIRYGFIQIDRGLLKSDVIASSDQVTGVSNDTVTLSVKEDGLLKV